MIFRRKPDRRPQAAGPSAPAPLDARQIAAGYHQRTKHGYQRYAASLGYLDWDSQPNPFRRFEGATLTALPRDETSRAARRAGAKPLDDPPYDALYGVGVGTAVGTDSDAEAETEAETEPETEAGPATATAPGAGSLGSRPPRALDLDTLGDLLYHSLALSAWKEAGGNRWALRVNPSSGNLHPTEGYLLLPALDGLPGGPGVHHYAPREHGLERRADIEPAAWDALAVALPAGACVVALTSIPWREAWKYGERAWRYCQHDVGHALGALRLAAARRGYGLRLLPVADDVLDSVLGLDRRDEFDEREPEHPDLAAVVWPLEAPVESSPDSRPAASSPAASSPAASRLALPSPHELERLLRAVADGAGWHGRANLLSGDHQPWDVIEVVDTACRRATPPAHWTAPAHATPPAAAHALAGPLAGPDAAPLATPGAPHVTSSSRVIRARRSAVSMDRLTGLPLAAFQRMLARLVPALCPVPWDALPWPVAVHLGLFVHRVEGLAPGLYALPRSAEARPALAAAMRDDFLWTRPPDTPDALPLFLLAAGDARRTAASVSCGQDIAADGAFSLGMLARFDGSLAEHGAPAYRELFWETGVIGQVLYLEAQALGVAATGIGCFFDDPVHAVFGLRDSAFQSLYHFTVGGAVDDPRVTGLPAYPAPDA